MGYVFLILAILGEVGATLALKVASKGVRWMYAVVISGYIIAFALLSLSLENGIPLGVAYGVWAALGVAATALLSKILFEEPLTKVMVAGIGLILIGIVIIEMGASH